MNADQLYQQLKSLGVELWCEGKMLRFRAEENALSRELLTLLRKHKKELVELLNQETREASPETVFEPPSLNQQALYFLHLAAPQSPAYNVASACRIRSVLEVPAIRECFQALITRHEALRTTFQFEKGHLKRRVHAECPLDLEVIECAGCSESELQDRVRLAYREPFDLGQGPLLRVRLFRVSQTDHVLLIALHHIVFDAWSLWLLLDEFRVLYAQHTGGETASLPDLKANYTDYVQSQQDLQSSPRGETMWQFWRERLSGELPALELPTDRPHPRIARYCGASVKFRIPSDLTAQLRELARSRGVTPHMLMLAIYKVLLHRYSHQTDLIVGVAISGRTQTDLARVVGYFVNSLAIRTELSGDPKFGDFLAQVKTASLGAMQHQEYPFPLLVEKLNPPRAAGRPPIFSVMFEMRKPQRLQEVMQLFDESSDPINLGGLEVHPFDLDQQEGQSDLALELFDTQDSYAGILKYNVDLFEESTAERIAAHYGELARAIVSEPDLPLSSYHFLPTEEQQRLAAYAGQVTEFEPLLAHEMFERQAQKTPDRLALICESQRLTYQALDTQANRAAHALRDLGVKPGDFVACCFARGPSSAPVILGILKAGAVFVPLDPANPPQRVASLANGCSARLILADSPLPAEISGDFQVVPIGEFCSAMTAQPETRLALNFPEPALAYVIHTSGSTGMPKGVCVSHHALSGHAQAMREVLGTTAEDRVLQFSTLSFDACLEQMFVPWSLGAAVVMRGQELWTPDVLWEQVRREQITMVHFPPAYCRECVNAFTGDPDSLESLRLLISGGDVFPTEALDVFQGTSVRILNEYGPTEAVITATVYDASQHDWDQRAVPIGTPRPGTSAYILDAHNRPTPIGVPGELCLGGPLLAEGYLNDPELTQAKFVPDPFQNNPQARMYRTGDRARWLDNGQIEFLGREDRQIKIQGMRVETEEVEHAITSCSGLKAAYVAARIDHNGLTYLVAWVVPEDPKTWNDEHLRTALQAKLPRYMIPRQYLVVEALPVATSSGKIDAAALPEPESITRPASRRLTAPQTPEEVLLAKIWAEVLNVDPVGVEDNFFDLGGGSLSSLRIITQASAENLTIQGEPLKPELLFEYPTIRELASYIKSQNCVCKPSFEQSNRG